MFNSVQFCSGITFNFTLLAFLILVLKNCSSETERNVTYSNLWCGVDGHDTTRHPEHDMSRR